MKLAEKDVGGYFKRIFNYDNHKVKLLAIHGIVNGRELVSVQLEDGRIQEWINNDTWVTADTVLPTRPLSLAEAAEVSENNGTAFRPVGSKDWWTCADGYVARCDDDSAVAIGLIQLNDKYELYPAEPKTATVTSRQLLNLINEYYQTYNYDDNFHKWMVKKLDL